MTTVHIIPILQDNYCYLITNAQGDTAIIDPGEAAPIIDFIKQKNLNPKFILNTHHHGDHIAGNNEIKAAYGTPIFAPTHETRIKFDHGVDENTILPFGTDTIKVLQTPGHTQHGVCYHLPQSRLVFTGDTLFGMGCGRLFEGTPAQMWQSLQKITALPDDTMIYCGHGYTMQNGLFCETIEPHNIDLKMRMIDIKRLRGENLPTIPFSLALEKKTNCFLRAGSLDKFTEIRTLRDTFK